MNACPDHPCSMYAQGNPVCMGGVCVQPSTATAKRLVMVVVIPVDAPIAPGHTFAISLANLTLPPAIPGAPLPVLPMPPVASLSGSYLVQAGTTHDLNWDLGNLDLNTAVFTSLPARVTYRPFWPPPGTPSPAPGDAGVPVTDALVAGLPLYPVQVETFEAQLSGGAVGPAHGPPMAFTAQLQSGLRYEQVVAPDPPFDRAYPPIFSVLALNPGQHDETLILSPDTTPGLGGSPVRLSFELARTDGPLDGWIAYLRDSNTKQAISPIRPLSGMTTTNVLLPTSHVLPTQDALTNAELVMAPPAGRPIPTEVFAFPGLFLRETYPALPPTAVEQGTITGSDGNPVAADLVFEATGIYAAQPANAVDMGDGGLSPDAGASGGAGLGGDAGRPLQLYAQGFEYTGYATAQPDPGTNLSRYQVELPRGEYRVIVRPRLGTYALRIYEGVGTTLNNPPPFNDFTVEVAPTVQGTAALSDRRDLPEATVEALPLHCPSAAPGDDAGIATRDAASCMPRYAQTTTLANGDFSLTLDPGGYLLRVEPADGARLPWVILQPVSVPAVAPITVTIPAPVYRGFELHDIAGDAGASVTNAIVRMFAMPAKGPAFEVGRAITDGSGRFDMYLDPTFAAQ